MTAPDGSRTVTVAPASPRPVIVAPAASIAAVGAVGAVVSGAWTAVAGETLPAASAWVTVSRSPLSCAGETAAV